MTRCSQAGLDLLEDMLLYDPDKRPTAQQSLKYPFFNALKRISPAAATKANIKLTSKYGANTGLTQHLSNNVLPVQEKLQTLTEMIHRSNQNQNNNNNNNKNVTNNNLSRNDIAEANLLNNSKNGHIVVQQAKNVSHVQIPKISFLAMNTNDLMNPPPSVRVTTKQNKPLDEGASVKSETIRYNTILAPSSNIYLSTGNLNQSTDNLARTESINDIYLNRNISHLFGISQQQPAPVPMQQHHPNVSFHSGKQMASGVGNRASNTIYMNGMRNYALYETAAKNAKNSAKIGGYYVYNRPSQDPFPNDPSKVYNMFSKVAMAKQNAPSELILCSSYEKAILMGSKVFVGNDAYSARSRVGGADVNSKQISERGAILQSKHLEVDSNSKNIDNDDELETILG